MQERTRDSSDSTVTTDYGGEARETQSMSRRRDGGFVGGAGRGADVAMMRPSAVTIVVSQGECRTGQGVSATGGGSSGERLHGQKGR